MKLIIASDIHGSYYYCSLLLEKVKAENPDRLLLLGDILYHGPRNDLPRDYDPKKVTAALNEINDKILCVRGNCEAEVDQMMLSFPVLADYAFLFDGKTKITATHGHKLDSYAPPKSDEVIVYGHTHVPVDHKNDNGGRFINPGSVSIPKQSSPHSYIVYEDGIFTWYDLESGESYVPRF